MAQNHKNPPSSFNSYKFVLPYYGCGARDWWKLIWKSKIKKSKKKVMNPNQYQYYKDKYKQLMEHLQSNQEAVDIYKHLQNHIKFDNFKHRIFYTGNKEELIKCYFPLSALICPK